MMINFQICSVETGKGHMLKFQTNQTHGPELLIYPERSQPLKIPARPSQYRKRKWVYSFLQVQNIKKPTSKKIVRQKRRNVSYVHYIQFSTIFPSLNNLCRQDCNSILSLLIQSNILLFVLFK
ncbi:unnamed protein product [Paramecium primaurelia]|uniref:Uncharacterized protein n=1 Tax=Paramecium primaurelia TaxID=5886 RepID=A0A8S1NY62_PARPR|nr:unnamed protein product [Paramecium primaurelia]